MVNHDFSDWANALHGFALAQIQWKEIICQTSSGQLIEAPNADDVRSKFIINDKFDAHMGK